MATSLRIETQTVHGAHSSIIPLPLTPPSKLHPNLRETLPHSVILFFHSACVPLTPALCSEFLWLFSSGTNTCPGFASTALGHTVILLFSQQFLLPQRSLSLSGHEAPSALLGWEVWGAEPSRSLSWVHLVSFFGSLTYTIDFTTVC